MALRISGVVFFSVSKGPPGASRVMKNVTVAMMNNTGINSRMRRVMNLSMAADCSWAQFQRRFANHVLRLLLEPDILVWMMIEERRVPALNTGREEVSVRVVING